MCMQVCGTYLIVSLSSSSSFSSSSTCCCCLLGWRWGDDDCGCELLLWCLGCVRGPSVAVHGLIHQHHGTESTQEEDELWCGHGWGGVGGLLGFVVCGWGGGTYLPEPMGQASAWWWMVVQAEGLAGGTAAAAHLSLSSSFSFLSWWSGGCGCGKGSTNVVWMVAGSSKELMHMGVLMAWAA